jgi:hypothetical protein
MNGLSAYGDCDMAGKHVAAQSLRRTVMGLKLMKMAMNMRWKHNNIKQ